VVFLIYGFALMEQAPPIPSMQNLGGGGAPIGSGIVLLISLAAGYVGKKVFDLRKRKLVE
jgi:hypothetical protein